MTFPQAAHVMLVLLSPDIIAPCLGIEIPTRGYHKHGMGTAVFT